MGVNLKPEHREGRVARAIEEQTAKLPSDIFLWVGLGFMAASAVLQIAGRKKESNFIGHWPTNILLMASWLCTATIILIINAIGNMDLKCKSSKTT